MDTMEDVQCTKWHTHHYIRISLPLFKTQSFPTSPINSSLLAQRLSTPEYQDEVEKIFASLLSARFAVLPSTDEYFFVESPIYKWFSTPMYLNTL